MDVPHEGKRALRTRRVLGLSHRDHVGGRPRLPAVPEHAQGRLHVRHPPTEGNLADSDGEVGGVGREPGDDVPVRRTSVRTSSGPESTPSSAKRMRQWRCPCASARLSSQRRKPAALEWMPLSVSSPVGGVDAVQAPERLVERGGDVAPLGPRLLGDAGPPPQGLAGLVEDGRGVGHQTEVGQRDARRAAGAEPLDGVQGLIEVEVGRRGRRPEDAHVGKADADRVAGEQDPRLGVVEGQVVLRAWASPP